MSSQTVNRPGTEPEPQPRASIAARTLRVDRWWFQPLIIFIGFSAFIVYATWAAFDHPLVMTHVAGQTMPHREFYYNPYVSPFYSPCFADGCPTNIQLGQVDLWHWLSPALYILIFPLSFRATCYYYRKAYYRSFWLSPPACAVSEPHKTYSGETKFPLIANNIHRYTWYFAVIFAGFLTYDAVMAFDYNGHFYLGIGTLVMVINATLIWGYTLGCHSCRHITGGRLTHFSKHPVRYKWWTFVSKLNNHHIRWAWASLIWVGVTDLYIRLASTGVITDYHHIF